LPLPFFWFRKHEIKTCFRVIQDNLIRIKYFSHYTFIHKATPPSGKRTFFSRGGSRSNFKEKNFCVSCIIVLFKEHSMSLSWLIFNTKIRAFIEHFPNPLGCCLLAMRSQSTSIPATRFYFCHRKTMLAFTAHETPWKTAHPSL